MRDLPDTPTNIDAALAAAEIGLVAIPCHPGTKIPCVKWKELQDGRIPPEELLREWFADPRRNIALICSGLVVFDCDDAAKAQLVIDECGDTPEKVRTPRGGIHLPYRKRKGVVVRNQVKIKGQPIDIRTDGGLRLTPPSRTEHGAYEWLGEGLKPISELPVAKVGWTRTRVRKRIQSAVEEQCSGSRLLYRGRLYVDTFDRRAVDGQGGHTSLFVAALKIVSFVRRLGGTPEDAWQLLLHYNATKCDPPWDLTDPRDEAALRHKLAEALRNARK